MGKLFVFYIITKQFPDFKYILIFAYVLILTYISLLILFYVLLTLTWSKFLMGRRRSSVNRQLFWGGILSSGCFFLHGVYPNYKKISYQMVTQSLSCVLFLLILLFHFAFQHPSTTLRLKPCGDSLATVSCSYSEFMTL